MTAAQHNCIPLGVAAQIVGTTPTQLEHCIRDGLFGTNKPGRGGTWGFTLPMLFKAAAVRALTEEVGLSTAKAVEIVAPINVYLAFLDDRPLVLTRGDYGGPWEAHAPVKQRIALQIDASVLWLTMLDRFRQVLPDEAEAIVKEASNGYSRYDDPEFEIAA